jgi:hypothetical protein
MLLLPAMLLPAADVTAVASETDSDSAAMSNLAIETLLVIAPTVLVVLLDYTQHYN